MDWMKDFTRLLFPLYRDEVKPEKAFALKDRNTPHSLFKYRSFNCSSIKNLKDDTVWLADPLTFNDPYDCAHTLDPNKLINTLRIEELENSLLGSLDPNEREKMRSALNTAIQSEYSEMIAATSNFIAGSFKLCSFSERVDSTLMWAHYADFHKGFCIEYDFSRLDSLSAIKRQIYPVIYSDKLHDATDYYKYHCGNRPVNIHYLTLAALSKAKDWEYEKEWRLVIGNEILASAQAYPVPKPKAVHLGTRICNDHRQVIEEICTAKSIPVFETALDKSEFKFISLPK